MRPVLTVSQSSSVFEMLSAGGGAMAAPFKAAATRAVTSAGTSDYLIAAAAVIWVSGAACVALAWLRGWRRVRTAALDAVPAGEFMGIPLRESRLMREQQIEPGVVGLWRQSILLPSGLAANLSDAQMRAVLLHEWHHARRRDNLSAVAQMAAEAVFWFHPLVWWVGTQLLKERELACDQDVLEEAGRADYAEGILRVCKWYHGSPLPCVSGITGADLRARIESVLRSERPRPLSPAMRRALTAAFAIVIAAPVVVGWLTAPAVFAQAANSFLGMATTTEKSFEVATVKRSPEGAEDFRLGPPARGSITIVNLPLRSIIVQSFRTQRWMVFGGPDWITNERYDIVGKGPDPTVANPAVWEMMRSLLVERFHLKWHVEDREMAVFALTVAKGGHKLTPGENGRCAQEIKEGKNCGDILVPQFGTGMYNMPIGALVTGMAGRAGRPVVDRTGLTGKYDVTLSWMPDTMTPAELESLPPERRPADMTMREAFEQVGLKLDPSRAVLPVLVIDSVDHPTPN
jgi:uncharacterized protein (TIGR03435 family)